MKLRVLVTFLTTLAVVFAKHTLASPRALLQESSSNTEIPKESEKSAEGDSESETSIFVPPYPKHCQEIMDRGYKKDSVYLIEPDASPDEFLVYCDFNTQGGGWTTFLYRFNGNQSFAKGWEEYKNGFGNLAGEFWLGLQKLHYLLGSQANELLIELEDWNSTTVYAHYGLFNIGDESEHYYLKLLGEYSGNAGNESFSYHAGMKFSTHDNDNDEHRTNCADTFTAGWWFKNCHRSLLTGKYFSNGAVSPNNKWYGVVWKEFHGPLYSLKTAKMSVRPKRFENP